MFFEAKLQQSLDARSAQIDIYDGNYSIRKRHATTLFELRQKAILLLDRVEILLVQDNDTSSFQNILHTINIERQTFGKAQNYFDTAISANHKTEVTSSVAKVAVPLAKEFAPDIAMWVTTFGKASTGKAISELSGIARTNAQLAILGGGTKRMGGKGVEGGKAFLAIVGPLSEVGIICLSGALNLYVRCRENYGKAVRY